MREIVEIIREKCNGCGDCECCDSGAIHLQGGKAIVDNDICEHVSKCIGSCKKGAIKIEKKATHQFEVCEGDCDCDLNFSQLFNWPCKLQRSPIQSRYYNHSTLLIAADCTAFAHARLHDEVMKDCMTLIVCPLDLHGKTFDKLVDILKENAIDAIHIAYMDAACCEDLHMLVQEASQRAGKPYNIKEFIIDIDGMLLSKDN